MVVTCKLSTSRSTKFYLEKFLKTQKNLSKPPPRLWPSDPLLQSPPADHQGLPILNLNHPILHKLESCTTTREFNEIHSQLLVSGLFQHPLAASRVIKKLCASLSLLSHAVLVFDSIEEPDSFLCNTILRCFVNFRDPVGGLRFYYGKMVAKCVIHNHYTFPLLGKICGEIELVREGEKVHMRALKLGFESDLFVRNSLIHMYGVCGRICDARKVFDGGPILDLVSWNSMIDGYIKNREVSAAHELFDEMPERDVFSWNCLIAGYVGMGNMGMARGLFEEMPVRDIVSWNCMIDGYARIGNLTLAREYFERMPMRNVVSWNTILALYVRCKYYIECLRLFEMMVEGEIMPNEASLVSVLTACSSLGRLDMGKWVHSYVQNNRIKCDVLLSTALLTMYAKCGAMDLARDVFNDMPDKNIVSWNSMIMGYGLHGHGEKALQMFVEMEKRGLMPNDVTFICVLSACTHAGMVLEGWWYFDLMHRVYKIEPKVEHYGCLVDLLGRAGLMKESEELVRTSPVNAGPALWGALLSACQTHSNSELGKLVAKHLIGLDPTDIGPYVLLSNIYAMEGKWDDVENVRNLMKDKGLYKTAASILVQVGEVGLDSFSEMGTPHRRRMLYSMLSEMGVELKLSCKFDSFLRDQQE